MRAITILTLVMIAAPVGPAMVAAPAAAQTAAPAGPPAARPAPPAPRPGRTTLRETTADRGDGTQPRQRYVTVFGADECPKPTSGDEIVVCTRLPDSEQYRIPTRLRGTEERRVSAFEYNRNLLLGDSSGGAGGSIGSCTVNGPGGYIGCNRKQVDAWAQDRANRMGTNEAVPPE